MSSLYYGVPRSCHLFWCYQCHLAVRIVCSSTGSDVFCPRCYGRFLHEIDVSRPRLIFDYASPHHHPFHGPQYVHDPFRRRRSASLDRLGHLDAPDDGSGSFFGSWVFSQRTADDDRGGQRRPRPSAPRQSEHSVPTAVNPGDYFTGPNLNELIDDLTQNDRPGLPPAPAAAIEAMPTVSITEAHLSDGSQCPVCKEEFRLGEEAREMPCKHVYHSDCIVPWLNIHNSCPVCRFRLPGGPEGAERGSSTSENSSSGNGGRNRRPERRNPFALLWPFGDSLPASDYRYRRIEEAEDFSDIPGGQ